MFRSIAFQALGAALTVSFAMPGAAQQAGYSLSTHSAVIEIEVSSAVTMTLDEPFSEISSANTEIADIATLSQTQLYLSGKTIGETTLSVLRDGESMGVTDYKIVVYRDITPLQTFLAGTSAGVELTRDGVVIMAKGCVDGPRAASAALRVVTELEDWGYVTLADIPNC